HRRRHRAAGRHPGGIHRGGSRSPPLGENRLRGNGARREPVRRRALRGPDPSYPVRAVCNKGTAVLNLSSAIVLGIIQGLTQCIPVSATAHLLIAPPLLPNRATPTDPHAFDTIIQAGTLLPALIYFRADWAKLLRGAVRVVTNQRTSTDPYDRLAILVLIGTI